MRKQGSRTGAFREGTQCHKMPLFLCCRQTKHNRYAPYALQCYRLATKGIKTEEGKKKNKAAVVAKDEWMRSYGGTEVVVDGGEWTAEVTVKRL